MREIVLGPPGTGKTTTLIGLVEKELEAGTPPDRIGYVTFTTRGANEAIERATKKFRLEAAQLPYFRTLHSLCYRQLGMRGGDLLAGKAFFEFADYARIEVTGRAWSDDGLMIGFKPGDRILFMENLARIRRVPLKAQYDLNNDGQDWFEVKRVAAALETFKRKRGLMDFTDMLTEFVAHDNDVGLKKLFVDEAQDLSALQWEVVGLLARSCDRVVVAGDDDQAIYRWAGADVEHLIHLPGDSRVLGQSYRCPPVVQQLSDEIISKVSDRRSKNWKAKPGGNGVIEYERAFDHVGIDNKSSVLILVRNAYVGRRDVEPALRAEGIYYQKGNQTSVDANVMRAVYTWEDLRKNEPATLGDVRWMYKYIAPYTGIKRGFKTLSTYGEDPDVAVTMRDLVETGGLLVNPALVWHEALDKLPQDEMSYITAIRRRGEKLRGGKPRVRLSTIHSAKGGEADHVVVMKEMAERSHAEMRTQPDDERRVWYVAVTRAREKLSIVNSTTNRECPWI